ncbi:alpha/beta fold hydrolase [Chitinophaga silvatica]|uniref:Alpha/beta fold hydrolase n=1 Tax=Chitinophaga silvatica TaxID=2282649 RepID=A0A3E1Y4W8_9BACT|nr:alpha/beta fold hydrolase [Chitinophaga silvatica]RFS19686.1 alpha/beta fold hydrolase [Chitinophaga silvatica]
MPILQHADYQAPFFMKNRHLLTVYPTLFRKVENVNYRRERLTTPDQDFIDLDFCETGSDKIVVILHGLEGDSTRKYVLGMVHIFNEAGFDTVSLNFRGCSGEPNKNLRFYHSGETGDLHYLINYLVSKQKYNAIHLVGFSLGGNVTLKYLGEHNSEAATYIKSAVAVSVPCDLASGAIELEKSHNKVYMHRFIKSLGEKLMLKAKKYPGEIDLKEYDQIKTFRQFDNRYTAPIHGFGNADNYWKQCSSRFYLPDIKVPTLLINALDDPFLGKECYPFAIAKDHSYLYLQTPEKGGHVGFVNFGNKYYWSEKRALTFLKEGK